MPDAVSNADNVMGRFESSISAVKGRTVGVSTLLSIIAFVLLKVYHFLEAYSSIIIYVSAALAFVSLVLAIKRERFWYLFIVFMVLLALSGTLSKKRLAFENKATELEYLADATNSGTSLFSPKLFTTIQESAPWFLKAAADNQMLYILIPSKLDPIAVGRNAFDPDKIRIDSPDLVMRILSPDYKLFGKEAVGEYIFAGLYKPHLKDGYSFKRCKVLDESVEITMSGIACVIYGDYLKAKHLFEKADSMQNPVAAMQLAGLYSSGMAVSRSVGTAQYFGKRSASLGCRAARVSVGWTILTDTTTSALARAQAEDYLIRASLVHSIISPSVLKNTREATDLLCEYYWSTRRFEDAYKLTRASIKKFDNPDILYYNHLYNCIYTNRLAEAKEIIARGEREGHPEAFAQHAAMLRQEIGYDKNLVEAEHLLKHAAELHPDPANPSKTMSSKAYCLLEDVYLDAADSAGAHFWHRLAQIDFKGGIDDE